MGLKTLAHFQPSNAKAWAAKGNYLTDSPLPLQAAIAQPTVTRPTNEDATQWGTIFCYRGLPP